VNVDATDLGGLKGFQKNKIKIVATHLRELSDFYLSLERQAKREDKLGLLRATRENLKRVRYALNTLENVPDVTRLSSIDEAAEKAKAARAEKEKAKREEKSRR